MGPDFVGKRGFKIKSEESRTRNVAEYEHKGVGGATSRSVGNALYDRQYDVYVNIF